MATYATIEDVRRYARGVDFTGHEDDVTALCEDASAWMRAYCGVDSFSGLADATTLRMICSQLVVGLWAQGNYEGATSIRIGEFSATWKDLATADPAILGLLERLKSRSELLGGVEVVELDYRSI